MSESQANVAEGLFDEARKQHPPFLTCYLELRGATLKSRI